MVKVYCIKDGKIDIEDLGEAVEWSYLLDYLLEKEKAGYVCLVR